MNLQRSAPVRFDANLTNEHVREAANGDLIVTGWASTFQLDRQGDVMTRKALEESVADYMKNPQLLYNHSYTQPAGVVTSAEVSDKGLWIEARLTKPKEPGMARHYFDLVKRGVMRALSVGAAFVRDARKRITRMDLREISIASVPVNPGTLLQATGKAFGDTPYETRLRRTELAIASARLETLRQQVKLDGQLQRL